MSEKPFDPRRLDVAAFARAAGALQGRTPQTALQRLCDSLEPLPGEEAHDVDWRAVGSLRPVKGGEAELWLALSAQAQVMLQCQRCLQPVAQVLDVDRHFRFVRTEDEAVRLDEESEDDVLVLPRSLDVLELLEDELLLALPLVPRHEICPEPLPMSAGDLVAEEDGQEEPHPFAALAALRSSKPPQ
jgi:uncharacterized protein